MNLIARKEYPALDYILWDTTADKIDADRAFHLYEKRWKYIDKNYLTTDELSLIEKLTVLFGNGLFLPA